MRKEPSAVHAVPITRTTGDDWPGFLGPTGDSKSAERGIVTGWSNEKSPKIVWQQRLAIGYGMPRSARTVVPLRAERRARTAELLESETGKFLWKFDYPTEFEDLYATTTPRCSPVVDDDRVYIFGAEECFTVCGRTMAS